MKKFLKIIFVILIMVVLVSVSVYFALNYKNKSIVFNGLKNGQKQEKINQFIIEPQKIVENESPFKIDVSYPFIQGMDSFNKNIEYIITEEIKNFKKISLENDQAIKETDPESYEQYLREYSLAIDYSTGRIDEKTISVVLEFSSFTGGAHGSNYFLSLNYSPEESKEIELSHLFEEKDYLSKISNYCIEQLKKQIRERAEDPEGETGTWVEQGAGQKEKNFSVFLINENSLTFYFAPYQVAPWSLGKFKVEMPLNF
jgi:hypothetical protein